MAGHFQGKCCYKETFRSIPFFLNVAFVKHDCCVCTAFFLNDLTTLKIKCEKMILYHLLNIRAISKKDKKNNTTTFENIVHAKSFVCFLKDNTHC